LIKLHCPFHRSGLSVTFADGLVIVLAGGLVITFAADLPADDRTAGWPIIVAAAGAFTPLREAVPLGGLEADFSNL
jgi:hypothetical protein